MEKLNEPTRVKNTNQMLILSIYFTAKHYTQKSICKKFKEHLFNQRKKGSALGKLLKTTSL